MKTHKRKKSTRDKGSKTVRYGARKKHKKSGHRGGIGMAGSGKRADQKKTLVIKLYGNDYFGKQGVTSRGTKRDTRKRISLWTIEQKFWKGVQEIKKQYGFGYVDGGEHALFIPTGTKAGQFNVAQELQSLF